MIDNFWLFVLVVSVASLWVANDLVDR